MGKTRTRDWNKMAVLVLAAGIYLFTFIMDPARAKESIIYSLGEIRKLLVPLLVAIFVGATVKSLLAPDIVSKIFGRGRGVLAAGTVGSILPPCPFISYPTIKGFDDGGVGLPATLIMLITATTVETGQLFCGLAVFGPKIVGLRISFAFLAAIAVGSAFLFLHSRFHVQGPASRRE